MYSTRCGLLTLIKILLYHGANLYASSLDTHTTIHYAALGESRTVVAFLIGKGVKVDARTSCGE